ncbi:tetratricopeptide repeat protein [Laceyella putida]|uniref:Tetratricopeptide repeat protein n=1 Tax=Laceyella putida TaxID=110101 RepID=A0ABW2RNX6_9BACL
MSEFKKKGDKIQGTYEIINVFPFVEGVLYYTTMKKEGQLDSGHTRFIHAVEMKKKPADYELDELMSRNQEMFFPIQEVFLEDGKLYQVFNKMEGILLGIYLMRTAPLAMDEVARILKMVTNHLMQCYDEEQFALVDPQNMMITSTGEVRFLFGGPKRLFGVTRREAEDVKKVAQLLYQMLTGKRVDDKADKVEQVKATRKDMSLELESLIQRALSSDPLKRPRVQDFWRWAEQYEEKKQKKAKPATEALPDKTSTPETKTAEALPTSVKGKQPVKGQAVGERPRARRPILALIGVVAVLALAFMAFSWLSGDSAEDVLAAGGILDPTVEQGSEQAFAYYQQSNLAYDRKQLEQAIDLGRKALSADLGKKEYYINLANMYGVAQEYEKGKQVLEAAIIAFPEEARLYDDLGVFAYYLKDYSRAMEAADRAVKLNPSAGSYYYHQGKIYGALKQYDKAIQSLRYATMVSKKTSRYYHDLAVFLNTKGELDDAINEAKKAVKYADRDEEKYYLTLGVLYLKKWEQISKNNSLSEEKKEEEMADYTKRAYRAFDDAVDKEKRFPEGQYYKALAHYLHGNFKSANYAAEKAAELEPNNATYLYQLGLTYIALGEKEKALGALEKAYQIDANNALVQEAIKKAQMIKPKPASPKKEEKKDEETDAKKS